MTNGSVDKYRFVNLKMVNLYLSTLPLIDKTEKAIRDYCKKAEDTITEKQVD